MGANSNFISEHLFDIIATLLAAFALYQTNKQSKRTDYLENGQRKFEVDQILFEAWELMGGN